MPVNDISRGALVRDIVNTVAITAIQAATGAGDG
jgi:phosphate acetyltransferase